jgi:AraC-like DNA-binding protein
MAVHTRLLPDILKPDILTAATAEEPSMVRKSYTPDDPALPMNYPGFVFRTLREDGHPAGTLLAETGLDEPNLGDPHFRCGFGPLRRLFLNAIEQTGDPDLSITLALKFQPTYIGLPAYAAMNAGRFEDGLDVLRRFFFLNFPAFEIRLVKGETGLQDGEAAIRLRSKFPFGDIEYFGFSSVIIAINGLLKAMLRAEQAATRAEMTVRRPKNWPAIKARVGFPVRFEAPENQIIFPEAFLNRRLPGADPINHVRLLGLCEQFAAEMAFVTTPVAQVRAILEGAPTLAGSLSDIAAELGYSERGLRRQLVRSGTSYRKLLDQVREQRARNLLSGSTQPIKVVAGALGFESSSNFARSFKRWTGLTPKAFREQALHQDQAGRK